MKFIVIINFGNFYNFLLYLSLLFSPLHRRASQNSTPVNWLLSKLSLAISTSDSTACVELLFLRYANYFSSRETGDRENGRRADRRIRRYWWDISKTFTTRGLRERKPLPTPKCQLKVIQDSNSDFRINPDVCRICPKMMWIHCPVGVTHFAKCRRNRPLVV